MSDYQSSQKRELLDRCYPDAFTDAAADQRHADETELDAFFAELAEEISSLAEGRGGGPSNEDSMVEGSHAPR